jgi:ABC-2 type transport system permease protein
MSWNKIYAIFNKQLKDTLKNRSVLIQFLMFPIMAIIMQNSVKMQGMPENYFVTLFASMYIAMAPITSMAAIISEEKEKNTLRVLLMSNVKPMEYLIGVGGYVCLICMMGSFVFAAVGHYHGVALFQFLGVMLIGIMISILIGSAIGTWSKNEMMATSLAVPIMMIFSFLPMLATFNGAIKKVSIFAYSQQIYSLISEVGKLQISTECILVVCVNFLIILALFITAYRRSGLA